jgi:protein-tyrosine phosphatase
MATLAEALQRRKDKESGALWADSVCPPWLFLGSGQDASNLEKLRAHQVTHILNVADDVPCFHESLFTYQCLNVGDFGTDKGISRVFPEAISFARQVQANGGVLLVHCANGSNRSAAVTIAIVMETEKESLLEAFKRVKLAHPPTNPLRDNIREL